MDSGITGSSNGDLNLRGRCRWTEDSKVYTRKSSKKAPKTNQNSRHDNATTSTTSTAAAASSAAAASENPTTTTLTPTTGVSSAPVATTTTAEFSTSSTCKGPPNDSTPPTHGNAGEDVLQESLLEAVVAEDADTSHLRQEQSPPSSRSNSADKNEDPSFRQPPSQLEDDCSTQNQDSGNQAVEDSTLPCSNEAQHLTPLHSENELVPQTSGGARVQSLRESPALLSDENGTEVAAAQLPIENNQQNEGELMHVPPQVPCGNGANGIVKRLMTSRVDDRVRFNLSKATPKNEIEELRKTLECELDQVRRLFKQLEAKDKLAFCNSNSNHSDTRNHSSAVGRSRGEYSCPQSQDALINMVDNRALMKVNSEVNVGGHHEARPMELARVNSDVGAGTRNLEPRPYHRQLSVAVMENNHRTSDFVEKEKRTPKANQYYRNSEFLLGKDRLPPESNKRLKMNSGRKHTVETERALGSGFGFDKTRNQVFKSCSSLLQRLMKHKHGWVFNEPVNAKVMGCADYHDIIKNPMDLGTIKTRLLQNHYKSPKEFAEDIRLVFRNAMTYNPIGHDVHVMAEQLLQIFEERWVVIETEYNSYWNYQMYQDAGLHTPTSRKGRPQSHFAPALVQGQVPTPAATAPIVLYAPHMRTLDRSESMVAHMGFDPRSRPHVGRAPVPKKPKAKDPNKRDMTFDEKQRLSTNLQGLPSEKLDAIVQIIKRRSTALSQHDDEIEVDIDSVDTETLWELDRFVSNYKKSLSKYKRKAQLALQARTVATKNVAVTNTNPAVSEAQIDSGTVSEKNNAPLAVDGEKQLYNGNRSSSSSSSSSDSGSTSSDSDSDSSSADGSDAGHSPKT